MNSLNTHKQLVGEGKEELNAEHLLFWLEWDADLKPEKVRFPILVPVLLLGLNNEQTQCSFDSRVHYCNSYGS